MMSKTRRITPLVENVSESTAACLVAMVQGNLFAIGLGHLAIALETGVIAGLTASLALLLAKAHRRWVISLVLGLATAVVDFFVHPGMLGPGITEAVVTGIAAMLLSLIIGSMLQRLKRHKLA